jgi:SNF2 family DNA or RNA helicase
MPPPRRRVLIPKRFVKEFMDRPRRDYRHWKDYDEEDLKFLYRQLPVRPPIWSKLFRDQKVLFLLGAFKKKFGFFADTGVGKTLVALALIRYFQKKGVEGQTLVLVPNRGNKTEWRDEIKKHCPDLSFQVLPASINGKWETIRNNPGAVIIETYAGLTQMCCKKVPHKKKRRNVLRLDIKLVRKLQKLFSGFILDESTNVKNHKGLRYQICRRVTKEASYTIALTGTPFGRDPSDLWAQLFLLDRGKTLGETLGLFRAGFFRNTTGRYGNTEHVFDRSKKVTLNRFLANRTIRYKAKETDRPAVVSILKKVDLSKDAEDYYRQAREALRASLGNKVELKNAFIRMRQISSGFLGFKNEESGERAEFDFFPNHKLKALIDFVQTIRSDAKFIIFHDFIHSGKLICAELAARGIGHVLLNGKTKNVDKVVGAFKNNPAVQGFVLNSAAGAMGLNLQVAQYGIYFESPVSVIQRLQTQGRFWRQQSQHATVFMVDFVARRTVDQRILDFHKQGADLFRAIVDGKVSV